MYIYLIENISDYKKYKIGRTKDIAKRIKQFKTGNPDELVLIHKYKSDFSNKLESSLHKLYKHKLIQGEWFELDNNDVNNFIDNCNNFEKAFQELKKNNNQFLK